MFSVQSLMVNKKTGGKNQKYPETIVSLYQNVLIN